MEVSIINFRSIREYKCSFATATTLLKGPSGKGKTTIFEAVKWCLYGGNKNVFPLLGKKETEVTVQYGKILIKRKKPSNLLEVKDDGYSLEADEAQEYINQNFGSKSLWVSYSYLSQNENHLLLSGSQNDKIELIKELIYGKEKMDTDKYYENIKNKTKNLNRELDQLTGGLNSLEFILEREEKLIEADLIKSAKKNKKLISQKDFLQGKKESLTEELIQHDKQSFVNQQLTNYQTKLVEIKENLAQYPPNLNYGKLKKWKSYLDASAKYLPEIPEEKEDLELILSYRGLAIRKKEILNKYSIETKDLPREIANLEKLKKDYYNYQEYLKIKNIYDKQESEITQLNNYIHTLASMENKIINLWNTINKNLKLNLEYNSVNYSKANDLLEQLTNISMECPYCQKNLLYKDGTLIENSYQMDKKCLIELSKKLVKIKTFFDNYEKANNKLNNLQNSRVTLPEIKNQELSIENITELEKKLADLLTVEDCSYDLEEIDSKIKKIKMYQYHQKLKEEIENNQEDWYQNFVYPEDDTDYFKTYEAIKYEYSKSNDFIKENNYIEIKPKEKIKDLLDKINSSLEKIAQYQKAIELDQKIKEIKKEIKSKETRRKEICKELNALIKIEKIIKKSEIEFLEKAIDNLNFYLNQYLSRMFEDIYIEISMFKKNKEEIKPNINIILKINGIEYENLSYLSGGEKNRISLALTISLNKLQGGSILLLDEVMASLDSYNRQECLKILKKEGQDKVILNICHETIEGYYDNIIDF